MAVPQDSFPSDGEAINPVAARLQPTGGCEASAVSGVVQDWYIHTQGINGMYERKNQWRDCNERTSVTPTVEYNYTDNNVTVWTNDVIMTNTTFSACAQVSQSLVIQASGACSSVNGTSGWGENGLFLTSGEGMILRPAIKNSAGVYLDPSGYCIQTFNINLSKAPGAYDCSSGWDTLANTKVDLAELVSQLPTYCSTFNPVLLNI